MERLDTLEDLTAMANLIWTYNNSAISSPVSLGSLEQLDESQVFSVKIAHDSNQEISECGFFITKFSDEYEGSFSPIKDYERLLWFANNYPGYGLSIRQRYEVTGQVGGHDGTRLIDYDREERTDIFSGSLMEMLSGPAIGEQVLISGYNPDSQVFTLGNDFSTNVIGSNYKIAIDKETFFKSGQGASYDTLIPLIYKGGAIARFDEVEIDLKLRIPKFAQSAGNFLFDLEMQFTSLEEA
jgi:hypothetical protein